MLYDRWQQIVERYREEIAVYDLHNRRHWTFAQLAKTAEQGEATPESVVFPQGTSTEFVLSILRGWRDNKAVCPLEAGQGVPTIDVLPPSIVHLKTTSATTGVSRLVAFKAEQLAADADNIVEAMGLRRDWPNLAVISLAHSYGFSNLILPLLLHGIPLIVAESPLPENVRMAAKNFDAITIAAVPALWRVWNDADAIPQNVRLAVSAGAALPLKLEQDVFERTGLKIHNFYGSSECGGIAYDRSNMPRTDASFAGTAMCNVELTLGENGCLEVHGRSVAETYWPIRDESLGAGVFRTSDLAELCDKSVFLRGRASDQINVAGRKVSPESIERMLMSHPTVNNCLVFGVPSRDAERSEEIVACVSTSSGEDVEPIRNFLLSKMPAWQVPRDWWVVESLETNQRGKLSRAVWREKYLRLRSQ